MHRSSSSATPARLVRLGGIALVGATLAACGTAPLSYLYDRQVYYQATLNRYPVRVVRIDGESVAFYPVRIAPGEHVLTLDAAPVAGFTLPTEKQYPMTVAPCTRYYIAAQRTSPVIQDWNFVVEETAPVEGCNPAKEIEKARVGLGAPSSAVVSRSVASSTAQ